MTADRLIAGRYRLTDPIGTGAMGVVWRATDVRLQRTVAVKQVLLAPGLSRSAALEAKLRAMREGRIAARLHHPNAITVFDVAEEDGQPWLVMEYMDAPSLAAKLSGGRTLPPTEVAEIGAQAAAALAAAHDAGIMHRDVKPANLLVGDDGTVKITDFGISRAVGDVTVTATGFLAGTPAYLAPEVARGEDPEPSSDVFALGSTLYAALEGSPPFGEGDNPLAVLHAVASGQVEPPKDAGALGPVLMRLLAPTVEARPTMREAKEELEAVVAGRDPVPAPSVPTAMTAPDGATTVLPQPEALGGANATATTTVVPAPAPAVSVAAGSVSAHPPVPPGGATVPGGPAAVPERARVVVLITAAVVGVLVVAALVALAMRGSRDDDTAAPPPAVSAPQPTGANPPPSVDAAGRKPEEPAPRETSPQAAAPTTLAPVPAPATPGGVPAPTPAPSSTHATSSTPAPSPASATPSSTPPRTGTSTPSTTPRPLAPTVTPPAGPPTPDRIASFIQGYYSMLPGNVSGAWAQLAPGYQAQTGYDSYVNFWGTIRSVSVGGVTASGADRAVVALTYTLKDGTTTSESRWIQVVGDSSRLQIAASGT